MKKFATWLCLCVLLVGCGEEVQNPQAKPTTKKIDPVPPKTQPKPPENKTPPTPKKPKVPPPTIRRTVPEQGAKIDAGIIEIELHFSEAMNETVKTPDEIDGFALPEKQSAAFFRKANILVIKVLVASETQYALGINQDNERFKTAEGRAVAPFVLKFHTKKDNSNTYGWSEMNDKEISRDEALLNLLAREGDKITVTGEFKLTQSVINSFGGQLQSRNVTDHSGKSKYTDEILAIRKNKFHKIKRAYGQVYMQTSVKGSMMEKKPFIVAEAVTDKTYLLERSGSSYEVTRDGSPVSQEEEKKAKYEMTIPDFLPRDKIVKKGDSFEPEGKWLDGIGAIVCGLSSVKPDSSTATITVENVVFSEYLKTTIVRFSLKAKVKGTWVATGAPGEIDFEGAFSVNATKGRLIAVAINGKGTFTGKIDPLTGGTKSMKVETYIETNWSYK